MVHAGVVVVERPSRGLREQQHTNHQPEGQRDDHAEVEGGDTGGHLVVQPEVDQEVRWAHARHDHTQTDQGTRAQPDRQVGCHIEGNLTPDQHDDEDHQRRDHQDGPVQRAPTLLAGLPEQGWEGAHHEADEQADELGGEPAEGGLHHEREQDNARRAADADRDEVEHVLHEAVLRPGKEPDDRVVDAEDHGQHATRKPGQDEADAHHDALDEPSQPRADALRRIQVTGALVNRGLLAGSIHARPLLWSRMILPAPAVTARNDLATSVTS